MPEYIEREKAIQICQSYYEYCLKMHDYCGDSVAYDIRSNIQGLPTTDVVEVVRCKDCTSWQRHTGMAVSPNGFCFYHEIQSNGYDFCSYGERKEGAEE